MSPSPTELAPAPGVAAPPHQAPSLRAAARAAAGVHGDRSIPAWRDAVPPQARRRVLGLALVAASLSVSTVPMLLLLDRVADSRGWTGGQLGGVLAAGALITAVVSLPLSARVPAGLRSRAMGLVAFNSAVLALFINLVPGLTFLSLLVIAHAVVLGYAGALFRPYLYDAVVPEARARALARVLQGAFLGAALGGLLVYVGIDGPAIGTAQSLILAGAFGVVLSLGALLLTDVEVGGIEARRLARVGDADEITLPPLRPSWRDSFVRLSATPSIGMSRTSYVVVGWCLGLSLVTPVVRLAELREFPARTPSLVVIVVGVVVALVLVLLGRGVEKARRESPEAAAKLVFTGLLIASIGLLLTSLLRFSLTPQLSLAAIGACLAWIALDVTTFANATPEDRGSLGGLTTFALIGGGVLSGGIIVLVSNAIDNEFRYSAGFLLTGLIALTLSYRAKRLVRVSATDLDARLGVDEDTQEYREDVAVGGGTAPALAANNIDFSYGSVQVLFGVDLRVGEGEMVALLGPNGVGKTTLLRVLSGLEKPQGGTIRLAGADVTDIPSSKRVGMGISQIVGGSAVFGSMTVYENLLMYGFSLGRDHKTVHKGIDDAFQIFPRLADRRNQLGSTLSGGEQQMLGLSKALITKPRILVVDEFSLGLAPIIVGELLGMVRELNARGTAVLVVEQSVNVALNLVDRCYFMEKGRIVYEGRSADLLANPRLVQELSLGGVPHDMAGSDL